MKRGELYRVENPSKRDPKNWHLIPLANCRELATSLSNQVGKPILLSGQLFERPYESFEDVWGTCRESIRLGRETYPCKKGTRKVTKVDREVILDLGGTYIVNKNN